MMKATNYYKSPPVSGAQVRCPNIDQPYNCRPISVPKITVIGEYKVASFFSETPCILYNTCIVINYYKSPPISGVQVLCPGIDQPYNCRPISVPKITVISEYKVASFSETPCTYDKWCPGIDQPYNCRAISVPKITVIGEYKGARFFLRHPVWYTINATNYYKSPPVSGVQVRYPGTDQPYNWKCTKNYSNRRI